MAVSNWLSAVDFSFYTPVAPLGLCILLELHFYTPTVPPGLRKLLFQNYTNHASLASTSIHLPPLTDSGNCYFKTTQIMRLSRVPLYTYRPSRTQVVMLVSSDGLLLVSPLELRL